MSSRMSCRAGRVRLPWGVLSVLASTGAVAALALAPADPSRSFSETTQVTAVEIPVQVVRDGEPVRGLTAKDFEVYDGRKKVPVVGFDVVDLGAAGAAGNAAPATTAATPLPVAARRHFLLLFDLAYAEPKSLVRARAAVRDVVIKELTPSDLVAVATYNSTTGPQLVLNFTSDRSQVEKAIEHLGLPTLVDRTPDPVRIMADEFKTQFESGTFKSGGLGIKGAFEQAVLDNLQTMQQSSERATREVQMAQVSALERSFSDLAMLMASVSGRKQVIYLSEGFDSSILQGNLDKDEQDAMAAASMNGESYKIDSEKRYGNTHQNNALEKMMETFRRSDCVIQAVDIGGLRATSETAPNGRTDQALGTVRASGEAALFQMAHDTGGELYRSFNDLGAALNQLLRKTSVTYVLTIQPEGLKTDGSYHRLRVEMKNAPRGARLTFRPGYYAPRPYGQQGGLERILSTANELMGAGASGQVATSVLAVPFRAAGAKAYVPVLIEADGGALLGKAPAPAAAGQALPAEIYVYAMDAQGTVADYFVQKLGLDLAKAGPALRQSGLKFFGHLELPGGDYVLRVLVRNGLTGEYGARVEPLTVPDFAAAKAVLLAPLFPETPGKWLLVRERPRGAQKDAAYPFMAAAQPYIPASLPALAASQDAALALVGWNWGAGEVRARARVLAADGHDLGLAPAELKLLGREEGGGGRPDGAKAAFRPPANLPPGEYQLIVELTTANGTCSSSARFTLPAASGARG